MLWKGLGTRLVGLYVCIIIFHCVHCRYLGIAFGLGNVWHFVNDTETKALTQKVAENILDDLIKEHFWIVSPKGSVSACYSHSTATWMV